MTILLLMKSLLKNGPTVCLMTHEAEVTHHEAKAKSLVTIYLPHSEDQVSVKVCRNKDCAHNMC